MGTKKKPGGRPLETGVNSKRLPKDLALRVDELRRDPELLDLQFDVALNRARMEVLIERAERGESVGLFADIAEKWYEMEDVQRRGGPDSKETTAFLFAEIGRLIKGRHSDDRGWDDVGTLMDRTMRLVLAQHRIANDSRTSLRADQAHALVMALTHIVMENVTDAATRANIAKAMSKLLGAPVIGGNLVTTE